MMLHELITEPEQIVADLQAADRWATIDELMAVFVKTGRITDGDAEAVAAAVRKREQSMSTGIGNGIGIPHAPSEHVDRVQALLAIAQHDVDFEALDGQPVRIVVLFVVPQNKFQEHLNTLANIARVLGDEETRRRLREATTPEEVLAIVRASAP
ncbi:MAG: PTS sugar transporter subunit IIA [Betaproteobacteria bacterium]|nr:MAG: PTS sugar transporter subunit IIA [Betaproteobacteria bacterium]